MDLRDATLMIAAESAGCPTVARLAQQVHDELSRDGEAGRQVLRDLIDEASGKGVLRAIAAKHSPTAFEAIFGPVLREVDRQNPPAPRRARPSGPDPLTAPAW
jgi:hypothetical protein